jgi:hypothetical protein
MACMTKAVNRGFTESGKPWSTTLSMVSSLLAVRMMSPLMELLLSPSTWRSKDVVRWDWHKKCTFFYVNECIKSGNRRLCQDITKTSLDLREQHSIPVQATTSTSLAWSAENVLEKVEELPSLVSLLLSLKRVQHLTLFRYNNDGFRTCSGYETPHYLQLSNGRAGWKEYDSLLQGYSQFPLTMMHLIKLLTYSCMVYRWRQRAGNWRA